MACSGKNSEHNYIGEKMKFSTTWKKSKKPRKQRNYRENAPLHIKGKFMKAHLSENLRQKHGKRTFRIRKGDRVKIMKGQFKGKTGKVESVDIKKGRIFIEGVEIQKKDGTKVKYPIVPSKIMIMELNLDDKMRKEALKRK